MNTGQRLIDDALKLISGCVIPSSIITNSGSLNTTYLGSVLLRCHADAEVHQETSSLSATICRDVSSDLDTCVTTLFPVSAILNACFTQSNKSRDLTVCQSAVLTFGAGTLFAEQVRYSAL